MNNTTARPYANLFLSEFIVSASLTPVVTYAGHDRMFATGSCRLHFLPLSQDAEKVRQPVLFVCIRLTRWTRQTGSESI